jgi:hypothetical protein
VRIEKDPACQTHERTWQAGMVGSLISGCRACCGRKPVLANRLVSFHHFMIGSTPQSFSHINFAASAKLSVSQIAVAFGVMTSFTFMI